MTSMPFPPPVPFLITTILYLEGQGMKTENFLITNGSQRRFQDSKTRDLLKGSEETKLAGSFNGYDREKKRQPQRPVKTVKHVPSVPLSYLCYIH